MWKVQKVESVNIQSDCKTTSKKRTDSSRVKREQTHPVCLHIVEKYEKVESINAQNDYETKSKKWTDKKTNLFCLFCKSV